MRKYKSNLNLTIKNEFLVTIVIIYGLKISASYSYLKGAYWGYENLKDFSDEVKCAVLQYDTPTKMQRKR